LLLELSIIDFAIIDELQLTLGPHLNVFTGETGAGKSIILDAISALVGERVSSDTVRAGRERASVEGIFDVSALLSGKDGAHTGESLGQVLGQLGIECEDGLLILAREVLAAGRGVARVNRRAVPISGLQQIAR